MRPLPENCSGFRKINRDLYIRKEGIMLRIGIRAHDVKADTFEGLVKEIASEGMHCCQLAVPKAVKEFPVAKEVLTPGLAQYMRSVFADNHVDVAVLGCYYNLAHPDAAALRDIQDTYRRHIVFASILQAGLVGTETGNCNAEYKPDAFSRTEEALDIFIRNLRPVVDYAERLGVLIGIEPVCRHIVFDAKRARKVLDAVDSPNLQIIFDPVNLLNMDNHEDYQEIIREFTDILGPDIAAVHVKDYNVENGKLVTCPCGMGQMDYSFLLGWLKQHKPYIHVLLEDTKPENALRARKYMEDLYESV